MSDSIGSSNNSGRIMDTLKKAMGGQSPLATKNEEENSAGNIAQEVNGLTNSPNTEGSVGTIINVLLPS